MATHTMFANNNKKFNKCHQMPYQRPVLRKQCFKHMWIIDEVFFISLGIHMVILGNRVIQ